MKPPADSPYVDITIISIAVRIPGVISIDTY